MARFIVISSRGRGRAIAPKDPLLDSMGVEAYLDGEAWRLRVAPATRLFVNGRPPGDAALGHGDLLQVGEVTLVFTTEAAEEDPSLLSAPELLSAATDSELNNFVELQKARGTGGRVDLEEDALFRDLLERSKAAPAPLLEETWHARASTTVRLGSMLADRGWKAPKKPVRRPARPPLPRPFGSYILLRVLGSGGVGTVYEALRLEPLKMAAIKVMRPSRVEGGAERFVQECRTMMQLLHPNVVRIFDVGLQEGQPFIAMEPLGGGTLDRVVREGRLALYDGLRHVWKIALALDYVHRHGIIHRDLKPGNIMLNDRGEPVVMDFGLAKSVVRPDITDVDAVMGTPSYTSPEQAMGMAREADPRSDVFSLGSVLYFLLTGRPPFEAESVVLTLLKVAGEEPEPAEGYFAESPTVRLERERLRSGTSPAQERGLSSTMDDFTLAAEICRRAMRRERTDRYETAAAFAHAMEELLERLGIPPALG